jgi:hypothetical protein
MQSLVKSFVDEETARRCTSALRAIPWHDERLRSRRPNVAGSDSDKVPSFVLGRNPGTGEALWYMHHPDFEACMGRAYELLASAMRAHDPAFVFHQITLNKNVK